jgi:hypothetical protein
MQVLGIQHLTPYFTAFEFLFPIRGQFLRIRDAQTVQDRFKKGAGLPEQNVWCFESQQREPSLPERNERLTKHPVVWSINISPGQAMEYQSSGPTRDLEFFFLDENGSRVINLYLTSGQFRHNIDVHRPLDVFDIQADHKVDVALDTKEGIVGVVTDQHRTLVRLHGTTLAHCFGQIVAYGINPKPSGQLLQHQGGYATGPQCPRNRVFDHALIDPAAGRHAQRNTPGILTPPLRPEQSVAALVSEHRPRHQNDARYHDRIAIKAAIHIEPAGKKSDPQSPSIDKAEQFHDASRPSDPSASNSSFALLGASARPVAKDQYP